MQTAGRWKSADMPAHYARAELAERGAIARYKYGKKPAIRPIIEMIAMQIEDKSILEMVDQIALRKANEIADKETMSDRNVLEFV